MIGYILFGSLASVFVAYVLLSEVWMDYEDLWLRLVCAVFWPITALVWLVQRPILRPMWVFAGKGFVLLGRGLAFLFIPVFGPISRRISVLWNRWVGCWPEQKRGRVSQASFMVVFWTPIAFFNWFIGDAWVGKIIAIILWGGAVVALIVIFVTYFQKVKTTKVNLG